MARYIIFYHGWTAEDVCRDLSVKEMERYELENPEPITLKELPKESSFCGWMLNEREALRLGKDYSCSSLECSF